MHLLQNAVRLVISQLFITLLAAALLTHAQLVGGTIAGDVVVPSNLAVKRAQVLIRNVETGGERRLPMSGTAQSSPASSLPLRASDLRS